MQCALALHPAVERADARTLAATAAGEHSKLPESIAIAHRPPPWVERAHRSGGPQDRCKLDGSREAEVWWGRRAQLRLLFKVALLHSTVQ